jgi:NADH:ubiquinone oxidoreductase subunit 2 (subunit N)
LVTIQKFSPFFVLLNHVSSGFYFLLSFRVITILVGGLLGYNQVYIRSLMAYSSISHTGWLILSFSYSLGLFFLYLFLYFFLVLGLFSFFSFLNTHKVVVGGCGVGLWAFANLIILCLSGIPPFSVFYFKVGVVYYIVSSFYFIPFVLFGSILSIYYYLTFVIPILSMFWCDQELGVNRTFLLFSIVVSFFFPFLFFL